MTSSTWKVKIDLTVSEGVRREGKKGRLECSV